MMGGIELREAFMGAMPQTTSAHDTEQQPDEGQARGVRFEQRAIAR
jgi:hypothetical protein